MRSTHVMGTPVVEVRIVGNAFLHSMIRIIVVVPALAGSASGIGMGAIALFAFADACRRAGRTEAR